MMNFSQTREKGKNATERRTDVGYKKYVHGKMVVLWKVHVTLWYNLVFSSLTFVGGRDARYTYSHKLQRSKESPSDMVGTRFH